MRSLLNSRWRVTVLIAVCLGLVVTVTVRPKASASGVVISQVYGGGGNAGATLKNDFIELFNAGTVPMSLTGWSVQYASATGNSWTNKTILTGTIQPGHYYLIQESAGSGGTQDLPTPDLTGSINLSGSAGKVALVASTTTLTAPSGGCPTDTNIVDLVSYGGNCAEGGAAAPGTTNSTAVIRNDGGATDTNNNKADFATGTPTPRNSSCTLAGCLAPTNPTISAAPIAVVQGDPVLLTVNVTPGANPTSTGIAVTGDLTAIGGSPTQKFADDGTDGDVTAADGVFSFAAPPIAQPATFQFTMSAVDAQARAATPATLRLTVNALTPIHDIQGSGTVSPSAGKSVTTRGIVTGVKYNGFFIQAPAGETDDDPNTSEGVFVYTSSTPAAAAVVGNYVQVSGTVSEFKSTSTDPDGLSMTELTGPTTTLLSTGSTMPDAVSLTTSDLTAAASIFALEKYEGMRVHIDTVVSTSGTDGTLSEPNATSTSSGIFFAVLPGTARPFREEGIETPLPVPPEAASPATVPVFDANPERIGVDTFSVFLDPKTAAVYPPPPGTTLEVTSGVTVLNVTGPLDYANRSYIVDAEGWNMPSVSSANMSVQPVRPRTNEEFTVATMNLARFYDTTNDAGVSDVALTQAAFDMRLAKASMAIRNVMQTPDIIGVEEVKNLPTLQALADTVNLDAVTAGQPALHYEPFLMEGHDVGGIDVGCLVRSDKVSVSSTEQVGYDTLFSDGSFLNDRPSLVLHATIQNPPYEPYPVTVVVNHLRSMSGIDGTDGTRVRAKRLAQTVELAGCLQWLQANGAHVVSVGDYNAFDVNDGYVDVMGLLKGDEADEAHVTLWAPSPVTPQLFDLISLAQADQRYSFVFDGNAQELDHILASADVHANAIEYARMNADFPESLRGDPTRPERLSDHDPIVGYFSVPDIDTTAPTLTLPDPISIEGNAFGGATVTYTASAFDVVDGNVVPVCAPASGALFQLGTTKVTCTAVDARGNRASGSFDVTVSDTSSPTIRRATPTAATLWPPNHAMTPITIQVSVSDTVDPAPSCYITRVSGNDGATADDWQITSPLTLNLRAERLGPGKGRTYTIGVQCADASGNVSLPTSTTVFVPHDQRK